MKWRALDMKIKYKSQFIIFILFFIFFCGISDNHFTEIVMSIKMQSLIEEYFHTKFDKIYIEKNDLYNIKENIKRYQSDRDSVNFVLNKDSLEYNLENDPEVIETRNYNYKNSKLFIYLYSQKPIGYAGLYLICHNKLYSFEIKTHALLNEKLWIKYVKNRFNLNTSYVKWKNENRNKLKYEYPIFENQIENALIFAKKIIDYIELNL